MQAQPQTDDVSANKSGPMVLVYIGDDDPSRGDSHGFKGIGQRLAEKLNGRFHYLENKHFEQIYPGIPSPDEGLKLYLRDHGKPDIMLSRYGGYSGAMTSITPLLMVREINEGLSEILLGEKNLVSHHLTPKILHEQGQQFRERYSEIKTPLIAVMLVNINDVEPFVQKMVSKCAAYDEVTVFICSSRRTYQDNFDKIKNRMTELAREKGLQDRLRVDGYNFAKETGKENAFNPYVGLINEADHIVVGGDSLSMVSEPLALGKPVITVEPGHNYRRLEKKGLVVDFNKCAADTRFETTARLAPVNITEDVANRLVDKFNQASRKYKGPVGWIRRKASALKTALMS